MVREYSFNLFKYRRILMSEFQKEVEAAFLELTQKYELKHTLLFSHNWILQCLYYANEPMSLTQIAHEAGLALPNVSVGVKALLENGMIIQSDEERSKRIHAVYMSDFGRKICDDYLENYMERIDGTMYAGISTETKKAVKMYYMQVAENLERMHGNQSD